MLTLALGKWSERGPSMMGDRIGAYEGYGYGGIHILLCAITWIAFVAVLISLARWLWLKGDKEKKGR